MKSSIMNEISVQRIREALSDEKDVAFAYIFGSAAGSRLVEQGSDLDMAVYFYVDPDFEKIYEIIKRIEHIVGEDVLDLVVLNGCEDFILRNEVLKGFLVFCRDIDLNASFFSWTLRLYENERLRMEKKVLF